MLLLCAFDRFCAIALIALREQPNAQNNKGKGNLILNRNPNPKPNLTKNPIARAISRSIAQHDRSIVQIARTRTTSPSTGVSIAVLYIYN